MNLLDFIAIVFGDKRDMCSIFLASHTSTLDTAACLIGSNALFATVTLPLTLRNCNPLQSSIKPSPKVNFRYDIKFIVFLVSKYDSTRLVLPLERNELSVYQVTC